MSLSTIYLLSRYYSYLSDGFETGRITLGYGNYERDTCRCREISSMHINIKMMRSRAILDILELALQHTRYDIKLTIGSEVGLVPRGEMRLSRPVNQPTGLYLVTLGFIPYSMGGLGQMSSLKIKIIRYTSLSKRPT